ncbi:MAG: tripartite tricarboxylate transporter TctB family protein [Thermodesulfobacteriota bacterium]|nr:tripartite tricarboxylate transporter TctB family protein [Thermodesulfobacteriota bacterium]
MRKADQITGIIMLIFSLVLIVESWRMPASATFGPGVGFLPFWLGVLMAILSILLYVKAWRQRATPNEAGVFPGRKALITLFIAIAGLAAYIILLEVIGFLLGTALLTAFLLGIVEREKWSTTILVAVLNAGALFLIFQILLRITLPKNIFGF